MVEGKENFPSRPLLLSNDQRLDIFYGRVRKSLYLMKKLGSIEICKKKRKKNILIKCYLTSVKTRVLLRTLYSRKGIEGGPFVLMDTFVRRLLYIYIYIYTLYIYIYTLYTYK